MIYFKGRGDEGRGQERKITPISMEASDQIKNNKIQR
jgi:hypothetical protein